MALRPQQHTTPRGRAAKGAMALAAILCAGATPGGVQAQPTQALQTAVQTCATVDWALGDSTEGPAGWTTLDMTDDITDELRAVEVYIHMSSDDSYMLPEGFRLSPSVMRARAELEDGVEYVLEEIDEFLRVVTESGVTTYDEKVTLFTEPSGWRLAMLRPVEQMEELGGTCTFWHLDPTDADQAYLTATPFDHQPIRSTFGKALKAKQRLNLDEGYSSQTIDVLIDQNWSGLRRIPLIADFSIGRWHEAKPIVPEWTPRPTATSDQFDALLAAVKTCATPTIMPGEWTDALARWQTLEPTDQLMAQFAGAEVLLYYGGDFSSEIDPDSDYVRWEWDNRLRREYTSSLRYKTDDLDEGHLTFWSHPTGWTLLLDVDATQAAHNQCLFWHEAPDTTTVEHLSVGYAGQLGNRHQVGHEVSSEFKLYDNGEYAPISYLSMTDVDQSLVDVGGTTIFPTFPIYLEVHLSAFSREDRLEAKQ